MNNRTCKNCKKEYKLDVTVGEKKGNLFADENGKWIQKETKEATEAPKKQ